MNERTLTSGKFGVEEDINLAYKQIDCLLNQAPIPSKLLGCNNVEVGVALVEQG